MKDKIKNELNKLYELLEKYRELNSNTTGRFLWRENAIHDQIELLEAMLKGKSIVPDWEKCYEEDSREI